MQAPSADSLPISEQDFIDKTIVSRRGRPGALLGILEAVQERNRYKYLPLETLRYIAAKTEMPLSRIYSVATFYALFNLQPQGENTICICRGTACHTRGSRKLLQGARLDLGLSLDDGDSNGNEADKLCTHDPGSSVHRAHRCLLRTVRDGAGRGGKSSHLRPCHRTDFAARNRNHSSRRVDR